MTTLTHDHIADHSRLDAGLGLLCGFGAYLIWGGVFPVFFKELGSVPLLQIVSHRIAWSLVFLLLFLNVRRSRWQGVLQALGDGKSLLILATTAVLIAANWLLFIFAIVKGQILQASLGYFITPLMNVLLGLVFLHERLSRLQLVSLLLAAAGVGIATVRYEGIPWIALVLALSFACYGLLRKVVKADALAGLTVETALLTPVAVAYLLWAAWQGNGAFPAAGWKIDAFLVAAGVLTAVPLLLFAAAARKLRLATVGFLQYLAPTLQFLLAVFVYGEDFTALQLVSFVFIWSSLLCYSLDAWQTLAGQRKKISCAPARC